MKVHYSSETPEWYSPASLVSRAVRVLGTIDLDPCSNSHEKPNVPALKHLTESDNGLAHQWHGRVYMNPPYGRAIAKWVAHLSQEYESQRVVEALALVPARTDTKWFRALYPHYVCFIRGRLKFSGHGNSAPFPSAVFYLGTNLTAFLEAFEDIGHIYQPL